MVNAPTMTTLRGYARHRGCSPSWIFRLLKDGTLKKNPAGKIDIATADKTLDALREFAAPARLAANAARRKPRPEIPEPIAAPAATTPAEPGDLADQVDGETWSASKARDARAVADLREMEAARQRGTLIERDAYAKGCEAAAVACRKELEAIQHRLAPLVAGESSIARCRELIATEVTRACNTMADTLEALAANPRNGTRQ